MIGITGATGHLGQALLELIPKAEPIGRTIPDHYYTVIIHAAAPDWRNDRAITLFDDFNYALAKHIQINRIPRVVNVGSWWQYATGECQTLQYTYLKHRQMRSLQWTGATITNVIPYSIYGDTPRPGRGFIPQLINSINTGSELAFLSEQERDFIHVTDVARACIYATEAPPGTYRAGTGILFTPKQLAHDYGLRSLSRAEYPSAEPRYIHEPVPGWSPRIHVLDHIDARITR